MEARAWKLMNLTVLQSCVGRSHHLLARESVDYIGSIE